MHLFAALGKPPLIEVEVNEASAQKLEILLLARHGPNRTALGFPVIVTPKAIDREAAASAHDLPQSHFRNHPGSDREKMLKICAGPRCSCESDIVALGSMDFAKDLEWSPPEIFG
jgi:hypothetical protein